MQWHFIDHYNNCFQQQQPKKDQKENAKIHANSNSITGSSNVKKDEAKKDPPKVIEAKTNEKGSKKKK